MGTPARPCFNILRRANDEIYTCSAVSTTGPSVFGGGYKYTWINIAKMHYITELLSKYRNNFALAVYKCFFSIFFLALTPYPYYLYTHDWRSCALCRRYISSTPLGKKTEMEDCVFLFTHTYINVSFPLNITGWWLLRVKYTT